MIRTRLVIFLLVLPFFHFRSYGQLQNADSIKISNVVNDFYKWYVEAIKNRKGGEFQPKFIEDRNGMTTLDCSSYLQNLERLNFSDSLIIREKQSYKTCVDNLAQVKFSEFKTEWTDLDDFEENNCDFSNYYRWIGLMEPIDGIRIIAVDLKKVNIAFVRIEYFSFGVNNSKDFWGNNAVELIKVDKHWKINKILSWK
jgi:hypothetical protein